MENFLTNGVKLNEDTFGDPSQTITTGRIRKALKDRLRIKYPDKTNDELNDLSHNILKIHGLARDNFDFINVIGTLFSNKLNDVSIDDNSNKNEKTIKGILNEGCSPLYKAIGYDFLYRVMKSLYSKREAKRLTSLMYDFSLGLSDSVSILLPYCWALDASKLVTVGRDFGQLKSLPCKRLNSYISALCETVHQLSSHLAGAIAIGTFFLDVCHLLLHKEKIEIEQLKDHDVKKYIENEYQQLVHSLNHLSRNSTESPFSNISIFDKTKLAVLIKEMDWYLLIDDKYNLDYVLDYITELQTIFLDFFDKGDPAANGRPYRFPVVTINISKHKEDGKYQITDVDYVKNITQNHDIYRYNIFSSEGTKISSCCRLVSDKEMLDLASQSNSFGAGGSISLGSHRVITTNFNRIALESKTIEEFWQTLEKRVEDSSKILKSHRVLINKMAESGLQPFISNGWINMKRMFSTYGVLGIYECNLTLKEKFNTDDLTGDILTFFNNKCKEYSQKEGIIHNIEQIPGESFAVRLANVDKMLFGNDKVPYELYANQFIPLWEDKSIWEKLETDGRYNALLTGGGIVHARIGEKITPKQAFDLIDFAVNCGCEHFALNAVYSTCSNSHTFFGKLKICPECGDERFEYMERVVGFFVPVSSWNKTRREWEFEKRTTVTL